MKSVRDRSRCWPPLATWVGFVLAGCGGGGEPDGPTQPVVIEGKAASEKEPIDVSAIELSSDELAELAALPEAERVMAGIQKVCPITGLNLGSMGLPIKTEVQGRVVFLCCEGCMQMLQDDPGPALARLRGLPRDWGKPGAVEGDAQPVPDGSAPGEPAASSPD